jgi:MFS family permease
MDRNIRWLAFGGVVRASGLSLILPYVALYLRNVLSLGYAQIGVLVALLGILPLAVYPFGGALADRVGRRDLFLISLVLEAASVLGAGAAMRVGWLVGVLAGGAAVSFAGALGGPALSAYVADLAQGSERTEGFTWSRIGWNVGFTAGVLAGGVFIGFVGFSTVGLTAGAILIGSTALLAWTLEPSAYDRARKLGVPRPTATVPSSRTRAKSTWGQLFSDRLFLALCLVFALGYVAVNQWVTTFPLYANTVLGIPYAYVGIGLALNGVLVVVAQAPTTRAALGGRHTTLVHLGILLYVAGFLLFGVTAVLPVLVLGGFFASVFVLTMGENVLSIPGSTLPSNLAPAGEVGAYNGAFFAFSGIGQVLATTFGGFVLALGLAPPLTWAILMVPAVPALALGLGWVAPRISREADRA